MALALGTNCGFVTTAPTADPSGDGTRTMDSYKRGVVVVLTETITITEMGWWCDNATDESNFEVGIYADSAGLPGSRLYVANVNAKGTAAGWKTVTGLSWQLTPGTYWLAVQLDDTTTATNIDYGAITGTNYCYTSGVTELPDPFGSTSTSTNQALAIYALYTTASLDQEGFRWRDDDGDEDEASWLENQDVDAEIAKETNIRLRVLVDATGDPPSKQYQLGYKESGDGATEWRKVPIS